MVFPRLVVLGVMCFAIPAMENNVTLFNTVGSCVFNTACHSCEQKWFCHICNLFIWNSQHSDNP
jgi:hypothetical protein